MDHVFMPPCELDNFGGSLSSLCVPHVASAHLLNNPVCKALCMRVVYISEEELEVRVLKNLAVE
jgi:hypothetical protein